LWSQSIQLFMYANILSDSDQDGPWPSYHNMTKKNNLWHIILATWLSGTNPLIVGATEFSLDTFFVFPSCWVFIQAQLFPLLLMITDTLGSIPTSFYSILFLLSCMNFQNNSNFWTIQSLRPQITEWLWVSGSIFNHSWYKTEEKYIYK
jgi:hypothetical protein